MDEIGASSTPPMAASAGNEGSTILSSQACAALLTILIAFGVAGLAGAGDDIQCDPTKPSFSDRRIVPGERIGPLLLDGKISDIKKVCGPGKLVIEGGPRKAQLFSVQTWNPIGLWVQFDSMTGNVVWISVEAGGSNAWAEYSTTDGVHLGTSQQELVAIMGPPERTVTEGGATSLYYDRRGLRFTVIDSGPLAGKVGSLRVVWKSVSHGDTLAIPGKRISNVELGMEVDKAVAALGGGYHEGEVARGVHVYYWPHLGLSFVERDGTVISVRAARQKPADAPGIRYATADGFGQGSSAAQIQEAMGTPSKPDPNADPHFLIYRPRGIAFGFDNQEKVMAVDVFPAEGQ